MQVVLIYYWICACRHEYGMWSKENKIIPKVLS